jgi:UDP-N-acetylglucosamine 2-epimerase (non-hydrolysing)/GDP/UDP-N,N'-diacetylbacillosamine 2-epimerase (hydrolysing)
VTEPDPVRSLSVLTTGRQDWGILRSTCLAIRDETSIRLDVVAGGMHLSEAHGATIERIREAGFEPSRLAWVAGDEPATAEASQALRAVGDHLRATRPDALLLVGDRYETAAAALAATLERVPIAHLHGGEQTLGAFDDQLRHAITKLAHLHFVSSEANRRRVIAMGEDPASVHVVGAPGLDNAFRSDLPDRAALAADLGLGLEPPVVLVTVHPATLDADPAGTARAVATAMDAVPATYVVTLPNVDPGADEVAATMRASADGPRRLSVRALGEAGYWGLLRVADAMLGNSSSGLIEAPAMGLPVVNVGDRQAGRDRGSNVIDVRADPDAVADALRGALAPGFREGIAAAAGDAPDGRAGARVAHIIAAWRPHRPPRKPPIRVPA